MAGDKEPPASEPGSRDIVADEATRGYFIQHINFRIRDPKTSVDFYTRGFGMSLLRKLDLSDLKITLYYLGYEDTCQAPANAADDATWSCGQKATLELTHIWGTESNPEFKGYHNGNTEPHGFGHIAIAVDDIYKACERFERLGVEFIKKPDEGKIKGIAFVKDPDGYWIEILDLASRARARARSTQNDY